LVIFFNKLFFKFIFLDCIPNRRLRPFANVVNSGFVVTSPLAGEYVHYVFCDKNSPLFKMPIKLYRIS